MNYEADFRSISDTAGFILIYPQALEDPNDGNSTNWLHKEPTDHKDIFFIETLIDTIAINITLTLKEFTLVDIHLAVCFHMNLLVN